MKVKWVKVGDISSEDLVVEDEEEEESVVDMPDFDAERLRFLAADDENDDLQVPYAPIPRQLSGLPD